MVPVRQQVLSFLKEVLVQVEMSRDLFPEVESLMSTANPYIRRKAAICAMRIWRRTPWFRSDSRFLAFSRKCSYRSGTLRHIRMAQAEEEEEEEEEGGPVGVIEMFRPLAGGLVRALKATAGS
jgi:AP-1 complex subunit gamma-1